MKYEHDGKPYAVRAKREVIVSAGAVASPQLLMLSGIGPKQELEKHGVSKGGADFVAYDAVCD